MRLRASALVVAVTLAGGGLVTAGNGASASSPQRRGVNFAAAIAQLASMPKAPRTRGPATLSTTCYTYTKGDARGDTTGNADVVRASLSYDCVNRRWRYEATFAAPVSSTWFASEVVFNTDGDQSNNCDGADVVIFSSWVPAPANEIEAAIGTFDSQCNANFTAPLAPDRSGGSRSFAVAFDDGYMGQDFEWASVTSGVQMPTSMNDFDIAPETGFWKVVSTSSAAFTNATAPRIAGSYRTPLATADFNGDGFGDLLFYAPGTAPDSILFGGAGGFTGRRVTINGSYTQVLGGDFDGDGYGDLAFYTAGAGPDFMWFGSAAGTFTAVSKPINGTYEIVAGDFNCDGTTDLLFARSAGGTDPIWFGQPDRTVTTGSVALAAGRVTAGDFNGDTCGDLLVWQPGSGADSMRLGTIFGFAPPVSEAINGSYAMARVGDFNGDGSSDVLFFTPDTAPDALVYGSTSGRYLSSAPQTVVNERYADIATGDFGNDGKDDVFFYGPGVLPERLWSGA